MKHDHYRIGLMGGSFDPVHFAHLRSGEEIKERFGLAVIEFIPTMISPHKRTHPMTDARDRLEMLCRAIKGNKSFRVSEVEIERGGVSYLYDTLQGYRKRFGSSADLFFIMGMDGFLEIPTWHRYEDLFSLSHFIVTTRPGYRRPDLKRILSPAVACRFKGTRSSRKAIEHESGHWIFFEKITSMEISATDIRNRIASGRSVRYLLPDSVWRYIQDRHLYAEGDLRRRK